MAAADENRENALPELGYRAYLLRCWQEAGAGPHGAPSWHFTPVRTGDQGSQRVFASLQTLVVHLREELAAVRREDKATMR